MTSVIDRFSGMSREQVHAFFPDSHVREITALVRFELARSSRAKETHTARFAGGTVVPQGRPDVTISAGLVDFVRLVTGEANAALLYLSDRLQISGDELLALAVGSVSPCPAPTRSPSTRRRWTRSTWPAPSPRRRLATCAR